MALRPDALVFDTRDPMVEATFWAGALGFDVDPDSDATDAHISDLALRRLNARQQLTRVCHAANFSAFRKILPHQPRQFLAEHRARARRDEFKMRQPAPEQITAIGQRGDEGARRAQFVIQLYGLQPLGPDV